jgi:hypothetical protein
MIESKINLPLLIFQERENMQNPTPQVMYNEPPKKSNTGMIIDQMTAMPVIPSMPTSPDATIEPASPNATVEPSMPSIPADTVPQGGLGDDIQRTQAWASAFIVLIPAGCNTPVAKDTTIEVTQKPDASGMWQEKWTIACEGGKTVPVNVTFTPSSNGMTDINVKLAK